MAKIQIGDYIEVVTSSGNIKGNLMPSTTNKVIVKLDNGYNIGISRDKIKRVVLIKKAQTRREKLETVKEKKGLPVISILHTGGTVASKVDYNTGAVTASYDPEELVAMFPELGEIANIRSRLISNMFSEDMRFSHYNLIAKEIKKEIMRGVNGIIITHGTDTITYTAAALAFIIEDLPIPVILVGAQRSSDRGSSDVALNLLCSFHFITKTNFAEVAICMHESIDDEACLIMPACKTRKLHSSRRDAFKVFNGKPYARVTKDGNIEILSWFRKVNNETPKLSFIKENMKIGILKIHPNMIPEEFLQYKTYDGLILEGTGLGHLPINTPDRYTKIHKKNYLILKKLAKKMPVVITTQTIFGRVNLNVYATGRKLQEIGILGNYTDMLTETAFIKLVWLLSNYKKETRNLIDKNLRGEISERITEEFLE